jgi:hypothetical protein
MNKTSSSDVGILDTIRSHNTFIEFGFADLKYSSGSSASKPILKAWTVWCIAALPQDGGVVGCMPCIKAVTPTQTSVVFPLSIFNAQYCACECE